MSDLEKKEIINALTVIKSTCLSFRKREVKEQEDPCMGCPFSIDEYGNCYFNGWHTPEEWRINTDGYWRAINE